MTYANKTYAKGLMAERIELLERVRVINIALEYLAVATPVRVHTQRTLRKTYLPVQVYTDETLEQVSRGSAHSGYVSASSAAELISGGWADDDGVTVEKIKKEGV